MALPLFLAGIVKPGRWVGQLNVYLLLESRQDLLPDHLSGASPFVRSAQIADGQQHTTVFYVRINNWSCNWVIDQKFLRSPLELLLNILSEVLLVFYDDRVQDGFGFAPVAFKSNQHRYFIPDELETLGVICQWIGEYLPVGNVDHSSSALVSIHPVPNFQKGELKYPRVNHIPGMFAYLNAVTDLKGTPPKDKDPSSNVRDRIT